METAQESASQHPKESPVPRRVVWPCACYPLHSHLYVQHKTELQMNPQPQPPALPREGKACPGDPARHPHLHPAPREPLPSAGPCTQCTGPFPQHLWLGTEGCPVPAPAQATRGHQPGLQVAADATVGPAFWTGTMPLPCVAFHVKQAPIAGVLHALPLPTRLLPSSMAQFLRRQWDSLSTKALSGTAC